MYVVEEASEDTSIKAFETSLLPKLHIWQDCLKLKRILTIWTNAEFGFQRQHQVLQRMVEDGYVSELDAVDAKEQRLTFQPDLNNIQAPPFVMYIRDLLAKQFGEEVVAQGGLEVITTLDLSVQRIAQKAIEKELSRLSRMNVTNAAVMVTNPNTGEILAMIGSRDYFDIQHDGQVNVTLRQRQPGSSIKPLTYAVAFQKGITPTSLLEDAIITYRSIGSPSYTPKNYDGNYHGKVTIRTALASSYNIPAVKRWQWWGCRQSYNRHDRWELRLGVMIKLRGLVSR
jgi:membrane peptidoglycan carboxypeptidase